MVRSVKVRLKILMLLFERRICLFTKLRPGIQNNQKREVFTQNVAEEKVKLGKAS